MPDHPGYWPAKRKRDAKAALRVCDDIVNGGVIETLARWGRSTADGKPPIIVAPALMLGESQNALARTYARYLAKELGWPADSKIYQQVTINRDFNTNGWFRFVVQPSFYGTVHAGRSYIVADDVCSMGGTLTGLRGFIESYGGHVIGMTVLACGDGDDLQIALADATLSRLTTSLGGQLSGVCGTEIGYGLECLTEPEGQFLLRCPSYDALRAGIDGARDG